MPELIAIAYPEETVAAQAAAAAWSRFWGVIFSLVMNEDEPSELDLSFRRQVKGLLRPGSSALLVAVRGVTRETVLAAVSQYGGKPLTCPLDADMTAGLWADSVGPGITRTNPEQSGGLRRRKR